METIYTVNEVAEYLKISKSKIYLLIQRKEIPHVKIGRNVRITESQLLEWIEKNKEEREPYPSWR
jgi:excisionase family DNA binding protein